MAAMNKDMVYAKRREIFTMLVEGFANQGLAASALGLSGAVQVSHLKTGQKNIGEELARKIEKNAKLEPGALVNPTEAALVNVEAAPLLRGDIPLIGWATAGEWEEAVDNYNVRDAEAFYSTTKNHGPKTYALRVIGDSMQNSSGNRPTYFDGDIIIVDPDQSTEASNTSRVIALLTDESLPMQRRVTFKQLVIDGPQQYLKPLNDSYNPIHDDFVVIGLVINVIAD